MSLVYDLDDKEEIIEPFVIKIDGAGYRIDDISVREYDRIIALPDYAEQFAQFAKIERHAIDHISIRKITAALKIISQEMRSPLEKEYYPKNLHASELTRLN